MNHQVMSSDVQCPSVNIQWWYRVTHLKVFLDASHLAILDTSSLELLWLRFNSPPVGAKTASHHFQLVFSRYFHPTLAPWLLDPFLMLLLYTTIYNIKFHMYDCLSSLQGRNLGFWSWAPALRQKLSVAEPLYWGQTPGSQVERRDFIVTRGDTKKKIQKDLSKRSMDLCRCVWNIDWKLIIL